MENRLYLHDLYQTVTESAQKYEAKKPFYDLQMIPSPVMQQEMEEFIRYRASQVALSTLYGAVSYTHLDVYKRQYLPFQTGTASYGNTVS